MKKSLKYTIVTTKRRRVKNKGLTKEEIAQCSHCNPVGALSCDPKTHLCKCKSAYVGELCLSCVDYHYENSTGFCLPCPCKFQSSDGKCHEEAGENGQFRVMCNNCKPGFAGFLCDKCSPDYLTHKSTCIAVQNVRRTTYSESPNLGLAVILPLSLALIALIVLVCYFFRRRQKRRRRRGLRADDKMLLTENDDQPSFEELFTVEDDDDDEDDPFETSRRNGQQFEKALNRRSADFYFLTSEGTVTQLPPGQQL